MNEHGYAAQAVPSCCRCGARRPVCHGEIVEAQALNLSPEDRAQLADRLITSLFEDHDIENAWAAEVERRIEEIESGRVEPIQAADSIARARAAIE